MEATEALHHEFMDKRVSLVSGTNHAVPPVMADPRRIQHVFSNLLTNALRHTGPGGTITVATTEEGDRVRFTIEDTGTGIPEEHLPHVFDRFYRIPGDDRRGASGLGLAITKDIIEAHGGRIEVRSKEGEGTAFDFTLMKAS